MAKEWIMVRIQVGTKARLDAIRQAREEARRRGLLDRADSEDLESLDTLIGYLAKVWEDRRRRRSQ